MKKLMEIILCIVGVIIALIVVFWFGILYVTNYKKITCDTSVSPDGQYQLELLAIGEPEWPFGSASGRLVLKEKDDSVISQTDFELRNDGGSISSGCWEITWCETYAEVILSGEEQLDEKVILYFDGSADIQQITEKEDNYVAGEELDEVMKKIKEEDLSISAISDYVTLMETEEIYEGYSAIQQTFFADSESGFTLSYSAKGNSRVILKENERFVEFLAYDRLSANNKCELYVLYRSKKAEDGLWHLSEAEILDIYAYEISTKDVVSSGKTSWSATGNEKYYEVTGEK